MNSRSAIHAIFLTSFLSTVSGVNAAGLWIYERGQSDIGVANAGRMASAQDASTTANGNPAGMTRIDGHEVVFGVQPMYLDLKFDPGAGTTNSGGDGGNAGGFIPGMGMGAVYSVNERLKLGLGFGSFFGVSADWDDDWVGRYFAKELTFMTMAAMPSVAYKFNDWLSVGAGVSVVSGQLESKVAVNNILDALPDGEMKFKGDDVGFGFSPSILIEPIEGTRFGLVYTTEVSQEYEDRPRFTGLGPGLKAALGMAGVLGSKLELDYDLPQGVMFSAYHELNDKWAIMGNFGWQDWASFGDVGISISKNDGSAGGATVDSFLDDTYHGAIGVVYGLNDKWDLMAGFAYDSSPVDDKDRNIQTLFDEQLRYGAGARYQMKENLSFDFAYELVDLGKNKMDTSGELSGRLQGDFSEHFLHIVNMMVRWQF